MEVAMAATTFPAPPVQRIHVPVLGWAVAALALAVLFVMLQENGRLLADSWETLHEFFHDGRHFLGVPCH
jgi:hypothetical protein